MLARILSVVIVGALVSACDSHGRGHMIGPSAFGPMGGSGGPMSASMAGNWSGSFIDQAGTATASWTMMQNGNQLMGSGAWSDWHGHHDGSAFFGVMLSDFDMRLMWEIPAWSMGGPIMTTACALTIEGNGRVEMGPDGPVALHGTYVGTNSCSGPVTGGTFSLTRMR